jgi:hypothetical protein
MQSIPQADPNCPWQILRLKAKILGEEITQAREELVEAKGDRARIAYLEQAERAQARLLHALSRVVYPA